MIKELRMDLKTNQSVSVLLILACVAICFAQNVHGQGRRHADLPPGEIPDPYQLYQRLANQHSLPSIAENNAAKYKELLKSIDPELLNKLSSQQKHQIQKIAGQILANADSPEQLEKLSNQFKNIQSQLQSQPSSANPPLRPGQPNEESLQNLVENIKNKFDPTKYLQNNDDPPSAPARRGSGSAGNRGSSGISNPPRNSSIQNDQPVPKSRREFNQKMNRLLFNAAKNSIEKTRGALDSSGNGENSNSVWQSLVHRLAESAKEHIDDPSLKKRYGGKLKAFFSKVKHSTSSRQFYSRFRANSDSLSRLSPSSTGAWILFIAAIGLAVGIGFVYFKGRDQDEDQKRKKKPKPARIHVPTFSTNSQLINSVDEMICWMSSEDARWWNSRKMERFLVREYPQAKVQAIQLIAYYEKARYRQPNGSLSTEDFSGANTIVNQLINIHCDAFKEKADEPS